MMRMMKRPSLLLPGVILFFQMLAGLSGHAAPLDEAGAASSRRALLIGVNEYKSDQVYNLCGALNDVALTRQMLVTKFRFNDRDICTLTNRDATRANILSALTRLVNEAGPQDVVFIHYSGHGSQVADQNEDEIDQTDDGMDETLIPHDGRTEGVPDITDDELGNILSGFKTDRVVIVFDCCHSGTATRSLWVRNRSIPADDRLWLYPAAEVRTRSITPIEERYILMSSASAYQEALDAPIQGKSYGIFTYALTSYLDTAPADVTPHEIRQGVERKFMELSESLGQFFDQEPQYEMPKEKLTQPLIPLDDPAGGPRARRTWVEARSISGDEIVLMDGVLLGVAPDSYWDLFAFDTEDFSLENRLAVARVTGASDQDMEAEIVQRFLGVPSRCRAVNSAQSLDTERIPVHLRRLPGPVQAGLESALRERFGNVDLVGPERFARFIVEADEKTCNIFGANGRSLVDSFEAGNGEAMAAKLGAICTRSQNVSALMSLSNPDSAMKLDVRVATSREARITDIGTRGIRIRPNSKAPTYYVRKEGDPCTWENSLILEITSS
ncbi:MAG: caspase family protein, partial [Planctomycetes bacterium]|nr:caspase family protein [Planctomycetota bacterium]